VSVLRDVEEETITCKMNTLYYVYMWDVDTAHGTRVRHMRVHARLEAGAGTRVQPACDTNVRRVRVREDGRGDDASKVVREEFAGWKRLYLST